MIFSVLDFQFQTERRILVQGFDDEHGTIGHFLNIVIEQSQNIVLIEGLMLL